MKTSIMIDTTTASGKKGRKTITDVNPNATNANIKSFAQQLVALTTDTYGSTSKVNVSTLAPAGTLQTPEFSVWGLNTREELTFNENMVATVPAGDVEQDITVYVEENYGFHLPVLLSKPEGTYVNFCVFSEKGESNEWGFNIIIYKASGTGAGNYVFQLPETDTYAATNFTLTIAA